MYIYKYTRSARTTSAGQALWGRLLRFTGVRDREGSEPKEAATGHPGLCLHLPPPPHVLCEAGGLRAAPHLQAS